MGSSIKQTWWQKIFRKASDKPVRSNVIMNTFGVTALWNKDGIESNIRQYGLNASLYTIVSRTSRTAAIPQFKVYRIKPGKKALHLKCKAWTGENATHKSITRALQMKAMVYEEDNTHPLNELLEKPNDWVKGKEFTEAAIATKLLSGERFMNVNWYDEGADRGKPYEVVLLPPQFTTVVPDGSMYGVKEYKFMLDRDNQTIPIENVIHSKYFNPDFQPDGTHLRGLSPVKAGRKNITRMDAALERGTASLQNAGAAGVMVDKAGSEEDIDKVYETKNKINETINGGSNSGKIGLVNGDWAYINFAHTLNDMKIIDVEKYSDQKLCNIYSFPPGLLDPDKSGEHNAKEFKKELITGACVPELSSLRDDWNEIAKLYKDEIYVDYDLTVYPELQEDLEKLAGALEKIWFLTGNEKRLMIGQDEDTENELMNTYLVQQNLVPIDQLGDNFNALMEGLNEDNGEGKVE